MLGQTFYNESLRKTVIAFGSLFNDIYISRKDSQGADVQTLKVPLAYGPKQKFIIRLEADPGLDRAIAITLPRLGFEISGLEYDPSRKLNRIIKRRKVSTTEDKKLQQMQSQYTPVPYNLNFELFCMAKNSDDGIQIVEQIVPFFQPEYTVALKEVPEMDVVRDVPMVLNSTTYEDNYAGDFTERRAIIYTFNFTAKAYVYGPVATSKPITKAEATIYGDLQDKAPPRVARVTEQAIGTPDADDNFGFNETISEWVDG